MSNNLAQKVLKGDVRAVAQLLTLIENGDPKARSILKMIYPRTGKAHIIGVTGAPGTGKSTLIGRMTTEMRLRKRNVGILTVDPTSPFSGGALLGDRIRMRDHFTDEGVFIRSLATRGRRGGVSTAIREAIHLLDAMGKEIIFIETIGVGQDQVEISTIAHTVVVVLGPWTGDEIQGMKAGLLEIADIIVVHKADLSGAEEMFQQLRAVFAETALPIVKTSAIKNEGIGLLVDGIERHRAKLLASGDHQARNLNLCRQELISLLQERTLTKALKRMGDTSIERLVRLVAEREMDPYTVTGRIAKKTKL